MDDSKIIEMYHSRDEKAIVETDKKYGKLCHYIAMNILKIKEDATECVNDTYFAAWNKMPPALPDSLRAFLGRITRNISIDMYRAKYSKKRSCGIDIMLSELEECIPSAQNIENEVENNILSEHISNWLESLPEKDCILFVRRYWYADKLSKLAFNYGYTPNQMAQKMHKLRIHLKEYLQTKGVSV